MTHENGTEQPGRIGGPNSNGTYDYGCFQVNSIHYGSKGWANFNDIFDADFNAAYAYQIYQTRGVSAWYAVKGILW